METDMADNQEMREAQRDYLDFLDDDVSLALVRFVVWVKHRSHAVTRKERV